MFSPLLYTCLSFCTLCITHIGLIPGAKILLNQTTSISLMSNHLTSNRWLSDHRPYLHPPPPLLSPLHELSNLITRMSFESTLREGWLPTTRTPDTVLGSCPWERGAHITKSAVLFFFTELLAICLFVCFCLFVCDKVKCFSRTSREDLSNFINFIYVCVYFVCSFVFFACEDEVWKTPGAFIVNLEDLRRMFYYIQASLISLLFSSSSTFYFLLR